MSQTIAVWDQTIDEVVYTKEVITYDVIYMPGSNKFWASFWMNFTTSGIQRWEMLTFGIVWHSDAWLTYESIKSTFDWEWEATAMSTLVAAADVLNFFD